MIRREGSSQPYGVKTQQVISEVISVANETTLANTAVQMGATFIKTWATSPADMLKIQRFSNGRRSTHTTDRPSDRGYGCFFFLSRIYLLFGTGLQASRSEFHIEVPCSNDDLTIGRSTQDRLDGDRLHVLQDMYGGLWRKTTSTPWNHESIFSTSLPCAKRLYRDNLAALMAVSC